MKMWFQKENVKLPFQQSLNISQTSSGKKYEDMAATECVSVHQSFKKKGIYLTTNLKQAQTVKRQTATGLLMSNPLLSLIHHKGTNWNIYRNCHLIAMGLLLNAESCSLKTPSKK